MATGGTIQSVERAAAVLQLLSCTPAGATAQAVAAAAGLDRTTVHRILRTLVTTGLAERRASGYTLGPGCALLGAGQLQAWGLRDIAMPYAVDLQRTAVGDRPLVVSVSMRAGAEALIVDRIWTPAVPLSIITGIGWRFPLAGVVSGRAMLSTWSDTAIEAAVGPQGLQSLAARLPAIRGRDGLEWGCSEQHAGVSALASPIVASASQGQQAVAALVVAGLGLDADLHPDSDLARALQRATRAISQRFGST